MIYGERIKQVREMHRMTQADLATDVPSLTQSRLSRIEKDLAPIDGESLALLATVTGVAPDFFSRPPTPNFAILSPQLRSRSRLTQGEKSAALQWARLIDEHYQEMRSAARYMPSQLQSLRGRSPSEAAARTRGLLGFSPDEPLPYLVLAVERIGVTVLGLPYSIDTLDAFCVWRSGEPMIGLLSGAPADRLRFSLAHELGHLVLHQPGDTGQDVEAEADQFAAELLAPLSALRGVMPRNPTLSTLVMLKTQWGTSVKALIRRARELGAIDADRAISLYKQISSRGWNRKEPGYVAPEKPRALRKLAEIAYGPSVRTEQFARAASWSEQLSLDVLSRHATADELPYDPRQENAADTRANDHTRRGTLESRASNVVPFRPRPLHSVG
jgi:Zn-dependent peptidase ImmA (M78 family)/DNA-binding XRE family transcriptional regulator